MSGPTKAGLRPYLPADASAPAAIVDGTTTWEVAR
jgi:hypothetical protein